MMGLADFLQGKDDQGGFQPMGFLQMLQGGGFKPMGLMNAAMGTGAYAPPEQTQQIAQAPADPRQQRPGESLTDWVNRIAPARQGAPSPVPASPQPSGAATNPFLQQGANWAANPTTPDAMQGQINGLLDAAHQSGVRTPPQIFQAGRIRKDMNERFGTGGEYGIPSPMKRY